MIFFHLGTTPFCNASSNTVKHCSETCHGLKPRPLEHRTVYPPQELVVNYDFLCCHHPCLIVPLNCVDVSLPHNLNRSAARTQIVSLVLNSVIFGSSPFLTSCLRQSRISVAANSKHCVQRMSTQQLSLVHCRYLPSFPCKDPNRTSPITAITRGLCH